jgi:hypothetical protein
MSGPLHYFNYKHGKNLVGSDIRLARKNYPWIWQTEVRGGKCSFVNMLIGFEDKFGFLHQYFIEQMRDKSTPAFPNS